MSREYIELTQQYEYLKPAHAKTYKEASEEEIENICSACEWAYIPTSFGRELHQNFIILKKEK